MGLKQETASYPGGLSEAQVEALKLILTGAGGVAAGLVGYAMINSMEFPNTGEHPGLVDEPALIAPATPEARGNPEAYWGEANPEEECPGGTSEEWWGVYEARRVQGYTTEEARAAAILCSIGPSLPDGMDPNATLVPPSHSNQENASDARQQFSNNQAGRQDQRAQIRIQRKIYPQPIPR